MTRFFDSVGSVAISIQTVSRVSFNSNCIHEHMLFVVEWTDIAKSFNAYARDAESITIDILELFEECT